MKKRIFTLLAIFLIATSGIGLVSAEEELMNETRYNESEESRIGEEVKSKESGNYNITFDDGYNGYCINYGDHAAEYDDTFTVQNTSLAVNHKTGESVANHLKTFFVDFHDIAVKDKYETQKIIWAFTDGYNYHNKTLLDNIMQQSLSQSIPDNGAVRKLNDTTEATFYFEVLDSAKARYQNFFGYKIIYNALDIENDTMMDSVVSPSEPENDVKIPETENSTTTTETNKTENSTDDLKENETNDTLISDNEESKISEKLAKHVTGTPFSYLLGILLIACCAIHIKNRRD